MSTEDRVPERPLRRYGKVMGVSLLAGAVSGLAIGIAGGIGGQAGPAFTLTVALVVAVGMGVGLWSFWRWWQGLDEAAREAHKWAWFWGATWGLAVGTVVLISALYSGGLERFLDFGSEDAFLAGIGFVGLVQTLGYGVAWAVWWLKRR